MDFDTTEVVNFFHELEKLKKVKRFKANPQMKEKESSADHSWRLAVMAFCIVPILKTELDVKKTIKMSLIHNLFEIYGDNTDYVLVVSGKVTAKEKGRLEKIAIEKLKLLEPHLFGQEFYSIINEYVDGKTLESKFVRALSKIETFDHLLNCGYESYDAPKLIYDYADNAVAEFPELSPILDEIKTRFKRECEKGGIVHF